MTLAKKAAQIANLTVRFRGFRDFIPVSAQKEHLESLGEISGLNAVEVNSSTDLFTLVIFSTPGGYENIEREIRPRLRRATEQILSGKRSEEISKIVMIQREYSKLKAKI